MRRCHLVLTKPLFTRRQGIHWAAPDYAGSRTALVAHKIDGYDATEREAIWRASTHAASIFNFKPAALPARFVRLKEWEEGAMDLRFRFAPRSGCSPPQSPSTPQPPSPPDTALAPAATLTPANALAPTNLNPKPARCVCLADKSVRPSWAYHLSTITDDSLRKGNRSAADSNADAESARQVTRHYYYYSTTTTTTTCK